MGEDLPAVCLARLRHALGVDRNHDALVAEFLRRFFDKRAPRDRRGIDRHLVGTGRQQLADVLDGAHAAADREWHETGFRRARHHVEDDVAVLMARRDVEKCEFVGAGCVIRDRRRHRIARIAQVEKLHAFDDAPVFHIEAGNDANLEHAQAAARAVLIKASAAAESSRPS